MARRGKVWRGFGRLDLASALVHSSNTYFAQLGVALGPERFGRAVDAARLRDPAVLLAAASVSLEPPEGAGRTACGRRNSRRSRSGRARCS